MEIYNKTYKTKSNVFGGMNSASPVEELLKDNIGVVMNGSVSTNPFTAAVAVGLGFGPISPFGNENSNLSSQTFHKVLVVKKDDKYYVVKNALSNVNVIKRSLPPENGQNSPVTECEYSLSITCDDDNPWIDIFPVEKIRDAFLKAVTHYERKL